MSLGSNLGEKPRFGSGQCRQVGIVILGDDQDVRRRLRVDIPEGERAGGLGNPLGGNITRHDPAKEAICHPVILACASPERRPTYMVASLRTLGARPEMHGPADCRRSRVPWQAPEAGAPRDVHGPMVGVEIH